MKMLKKRADFISAPLVKVGMGGLANTLVWKEVELSRAVGVNVEAVFVAGCFEDMPTVLRMQKYPIILGDGPSGRLIVRALSNMRCKLEAIKIAVEREVVRVAERSFGTVYGIQSVSSSQGGIGVSVNAMSAPILHSIAQRTFDKDTDIFIIEKILTGLEAYKLAAFNEAVCEMAAVKNIEKGYISEAFVLLPGIRYQDDLDMWCEVDRFLLSRPLITGGLEDIINTFINCKSQVVIVPEPFGLDLNSKLDKRVLLSRIVLNSLYHAIEYMRRRKLNPCSGFALIAGPVTVEEVSTVCNEIGEKLSVDIRGIPYYLPKSRNVVAYAALGVSPQEVFTRARDRASELLELFRSRGQYPELHQYSDPEELVRKLIEEGERHV